MNIGILGGGQLAQMLALAGIPLGFRFRFFDPSPSAPAACAGKHILASFDDTAALDAFCEGLDVITYEFENIPASTVEYVTKRLPVRPSLECLTATQERLAEKTLFQQLNIPTAAFVTVDVAEDLKTVASQIGFPCMFKARRSGYDGKGQRLVKSAEELLPAWEALGSVPIIAEQYIRFTREVSLIAVRSLHGAMKYYALTENYHRDGILRRSLAPASSPLQSTAESYASLVMKHLNYVGVLCIEFFESNGGLIANEMAPRVHNSGHWTIEGAKTSQFENHLRAITDMPLGSTDIISPTVMMNIIGTVPDTRALMDIENAHIHLYGKSAKPGRKLGHITILGGKTSPEIEKMLHM